MKVFIHPRRVRLARRLLLLAAALPLLQLGACQTAAGQTSLLVAPQLPNLILSSVGSAVINTLLSLLNTTTYSLFAGT